MKRIFFYISALATILCACNKIDDQSSQDGNEPEAEVKMITEIVSGSQGSSTKATIADADASFKWTAGDNIAVHVSNGESHKYIFTSDSGASGASVAAASASFT